MRIEERENTTAGSDVGSHEVRGMSAAGWWLAVATQANRRTLWLSRELGFVFGGSRVKVTSQKPAICADFTWFYSVPRCKYRDSTSDYQRRCFPYHFKLIYHLFIVCYGIWPELLIASLNKQQTVVWTMCLFWGRPHAAEQVVGSEVRTNVWTFQYQLSACDVGRLVLVLWVVSKYRAGQCSVCMSSVRK
jgi:hypothetical protein